MPGIGEKTAERLAFFVMDLDEEKTDVIKALYGTELEMSEDILDIVVFKGVDKDTRRIIGKIIIINID